MYTDGNGRVHGDGLIESKMNYVRTYMVLHPSVQLRLEVALEFEALATEKYTGRYPGILMPLSFITDASTHI